ncbi:MAG: tyrosine-type recombinase/integrase [Oscillospiraceae bacterium]|nr:tyrosine-type recombinase/integrase [Oscillospiraceae bacterium]
MQKTENVLLTMIHDFFLIYLPNRRKCSPHTIQAYRTAVEQLVDYASKQLHCRLTAITFDVLDCSMIASFLDSLEQRGCSISTRNHKLKAIRALFAYAAMMDISLSRYYKELDKIPLKKCETPSGIEFLTEAEVRALFEQPDTSTNKGVRDLLVMIMLYDTGARIQELLNVRICDIQFAKSPTVQVLGKGGKYRFIPIMPKTVEHLRRYMELFHPGKTEYAHEYLFYTERRGIRAQMSDDNVRKLLRSYADSARSSCPSMPNNLHPHHFRHSRAMHLYQHGMELALVSQWLGHANLETTLIYAHADTEMKRRAIEKASSDICNVGTDATMPDSFDDDTLKRLYGLR